MWLDPDPMWTDPDPMWIVSFSSDGTCIVWYAHPWAGRAGAAGRPGGQPDGRRDRRTGPLDGWIGGLHKVDGWMNRCYGCSDAQMHWDWILGRARVDGRRWSSAMPVFTTRHAHAVGCVQFPFNGSL